VNDPNVRYWPIADIPSCNLPIDFGLKYHGTFYSTVGGGRVPGSL
jgi:hypothetical protein